jgi:hypothetical protein
MTTGMRTFGWLPDAADASCTHYVPANHDEVPYAYGTALVAVCGARCIPVYPGDQLAALPHCPNCSARPHRAPVPKQRTVTRTPHPAPGVVAA